MKTIQYTGHNVLEVMSKESKNRNNYIENVIAYVFELNNLNSKKSLLEFGAGLGEFINRFEKYDNIETFAIEIEPLYKEELAKKHTSFFSIEMLREKMDYIYSIDVLEHLKDDSKILEQFYQTLKINGILFIYVPARQELYSKFDENIGHYRRYSMKELKKKVENAGFTIDKIYYDDFLGYFASLLNKFISNKGELNPIAVRLYDKYFFPLNKYFNIFTNKIIGKSLIIIAKKTTKM